MNTISTSLNNLACQIKQWGLELGFQQIAITDTNLYSEEPRLRDWLNKQYHGDMQWMARYGMMRARPQELLPGTLRVISVRMNYLPANASFAEVLKNDQLGYISRYALGRDYHKVMKQRLKALGDKIINHCKEMGDDIILRPFVDSAPIMERPLAEKAGLGWTGKHSLLINEQAGSWFFLGELLINLPLPIDKPVNEQCNRCVACITSCPTGAIIAPGVIDARRCISYLTIESEGGIPEHLRTLMGNRIYGCDDCQLVCPWNQVSPITAEKDFSPKNQLLSPHLLDLYRWDEATFLKMTEGNAIRRIGYFRWLRNITIALGNARYQQEIITALQMRQGFSNILDEHIIWSINQQKQKINKRNTDRADSKKIRLIRIIEKGLPRDA